MIDMRIFFIRLKRILKIFEDFLFVNRKQGLPEFYEGDKELLAQYCKIMKPVMKPASISCSPKKMPTWTFILPNQKLMKDKVAGLKNDTMLASLRVKKW